MAYNYYQPQASAASTYNYYNPSSGYGSGNGSNWWQGDFSQTPIGHDYLEDNQEAAYTRFLAERGYRDFTGEGEFARQQFGKVKSGYGAALATNPNLAFQTYLQDVGGNLREQYRRLTPEQRGENPQMYSPRARYIPR